MCWHCLKENSDGAHDQNLEIRQRCLLHWGSACGQYCCFEVQYSEGVVACFCRLCQEQVSWEHEELAQELGAPVPSQQLKV